VFGFHVVEETVKLLVHGRDFLGVRLDDLLARSVVIFGTFIPFFCFPGVGAGYRTR
jgi:hypothetical protein